MPSEIIQFDEFHLDLGRYQLRRGDRVIKLEKNPMELLILLAQNQGRLVTREDIIQRLWGDSVFVDTRHGINTAVHKDERYAVNVRKPLEMVASDSFELSQYRKLSRQSPRVQARRLLPPQHRT